MLLGATFTKDECKFLNSHPAFISQLEKTATDDDFERLCALSEELLQAERRVSKAAQQLRRE